MFCLIIIYKHGDCRILDVILNKCNVEKIRINVSYIEK
jgi:hypothetical protein